MRAAVVLIALLPLPALADCPVGTEIFFCPAGKKAIQVCLQGTTVTYRYGTVARPDLSLTVPLQDADYVPWNGIGRTMWDSLAFHNKGYSYEVWAATDKMMDEADPPSVLQGGVNVMKGDKLQAQVTCDKGRVSSTLDLLYERKTAIGQCWNYTSNAWQPAPCP